MYNFHRKCSNLLLKETKTIQRLFKTRENFKDLDFREATQHDKKAVLTLRHNVYRGLDYLADYYDYFIQDSNRRCIVGEIGWKSGFVRRDFISGRQRIYLKSSWTSTRNVRGTGNIWCNE
ncbi:uncharacterized protein LOC123535049 isoform X1 [Mercenaria mercenaria]|uniref:uncharacterized protein LOC123535049 isoform X1 n=1 Tax=Mercenaria mercenaria TaxID=6596 RepID=UPI00234F5E1D|nr:uncharacterized protein LOC123535049 isoform X1 [Mercenaria mercenaria]